MRFGGSRVLLDIEGTTSSVSYVFDVMFPFAKQHLADYLADHWNDAEIIDVLEQVARDANCDSLTELCQSRDETVCREFVVRHLSKLMDDDVKATGLKQLQGILWRAGFESGELQAHLFEDVEPCLRRWRARGKDLRIYSSGSVEAQKLFFGHTIKGNLLSLFSGHYDTRIGSKREAQSYQRIAEDWGSDPGDILFLSDVVAELDAARVAGLQTCLVRRPGNTRPPAGHTHAEVETFEQVSIEC